MNIIKDLQLIKTYENKPIYHPLCRIQDWSLKDDAYALNKYQECYNLSLIYRSSTTFSNDIPEFARKEMKRKICQSINDYVYGDAIRMLHEIYMAVIALDFERSRELIETTINELKDCWHEQI